MKFYSSVYLFFFFAIFVITGLTAETIVGQSDSESVQIGIWKTLYLPDRQLVPGQPNS